MHADTREENTISMEGVKINNIVFQQLFFL